jgi:hypothetical protein
MVYYRRLTDDQEGASLEGLLTIIFSYCIGAERKMGFLKSATPLMAKTDLATVFTTLPIHTQQICSQTEDDGKTFLENIITSVEGYAEKMTLPLFDNVINVEENYAKKGGIIPGTPWYYSLTLRDWIRGITLRDQSKQNSIRALFSDSDNKGKDLLTNAHFPKKPRNREIEGYGALGDRVDIDPATADQLPVFELRSMSRSLRFGELPNWCLKTFRYIKSLNENPHGGHQLIT